MFLMAEVWGKLLGVGWEDPPILAVTTNPLRTLRREEEESEKKSGWTGGWGHGGRVQNMRRKHEERFRRAVEARPFS